MFRLSDLPDALRVQAEHQLASAPAPRIPPRPAPALADVPYSPKSVRRPPSRDQRGVPNKTEADYNNAVLRGMGRFEPVILRTPGGNYTPDFMTIDDGIVTFHEVKGSYRLPSESRATIGFLSAAAAFPFWRFVWARKEKDGSWSVRKVLNGADPAPLSETETRNV